MANERDNLCPKCSTIAYADFWDPSVDESVTGSCFQRPFGDIKRTRNCPICRLVCQALQRKGPCLTVPAADALIYYSQVLHGKYLLNDTLTHNQTNSSVVKRTNRLRVSTRFQYSAYADMERFPRRAFAYQDGPNEDYFEGDIMLLKDENDSERLFHGRKMDETLNISLIKSWISTCSEGCKPHGISRSHRAFLGPKRLINTKQLLVQCTPATCDYAALSCTWGPKTIPQLRLEKSNERQLAMPGGLKKCWNDIPRTIQDAICLCDALSIEYLWVDALCHGTGEGFENQGGIEDIDQIFAEAFLTIVGNGPNSHYGLKGVCSVSHPSYRHQNFEHVGQMTLAVSKPLTDESMSESGWMRRYWPLIEFVVSQHLLVLTDEQAFFCCKAKQGLYSEDTHSEMNSDTSKMVKNVELPEIDPFWSTYANMEKPSDKYAAFIAELKKRGVTKFDDLSRGFGVGLCHLGAEMGTTYHYGLPLKFFAGAFCFMVSPGKRLPLVGFPSWSWHGWDASDAFYYESMWDFEGMFESDEPCFYASESPATEAFQLPVLKSKFIDFTTSPCSSNRNSFCFEFPHGLPKELERHLLVLEAIVVDLSAFKHDDEWRVFIKQDGCRHEVGIANLDLTHDDFVEVYVSFILIGYCQYNMAFYLVATPSGYGHTLCRVGSCMNLDLTKISERLRKEIIYLI